MEDLRHFLKEHAVFGHLTADEQQQILDHSSYRTFDKNHTVIHSSEAEPDIFLVLEGMCKNTIVTDDGREMMIRFYSPGDLAGLISAVSHQNMNFTVQTLEKSSFLVIPHNIFNDLLHQNVQFAEIIAREVSQRVHHMYDNLHHELSYQARGMDTFPFRKKVGEIMRTPVVTLSGNPSAVELARHMIENRVSSVILQDERNPLKNIVTEKDILRVVAREKDPSALRADQISDHKKIISISPDAYFYEALLLMIKHKIKHLPVVHEGRPVGLVTMQDLTRARGMAVLSVVDEIERQTTIEGLARSRGQIRQVLDAMLKEKASIHDITSIISELNDRLLRRIITLSEEAMIRENEGPPPVEYCWLALGSEGRKEQTLATDQDNAIIYEDVDESEQEQVDRYFARLAEKIVSGLETCGFPRCEGGVMAINQKWRHSLSRWKKEIDAWLSNLDGDEVRSFTIFLDFRGVYGKTELADGIRDYLIRQTKSQSLLFNRLALDDSRHPVPIGLFGRLVTEKDNENNPIIDLKHGGVMHIVNAARIFALREGIRDTGTVARLNRLVEKRVFQEREQREIMDAFNTLMLLRVRLNLNQMDQDQPLNNNLNLNTLNKNERWQLKKSLTTVKWVQQMTGRHFHINV
ncbi:MAG: CBS domain-containing protein [Bacillaceae bacterium]|nr:CBS domain-containing protein [Bacillaceae bacterium]